MRNANWAKGLENTLEAVRDNYYFKCTLNPKECQEKFRFKHLLKKHEVLELNPHALANHTQHN